MIRRCKIHLFRVIKSITRFFTTRRRLQIETKGTNTPSVKFSAFGTIVCPQIFGHAIHEGFVPWLFSIHILWVVSFCILICPCVLFLRAALRTVIFRALWALSDAILFGTPRRGPVEFLQQSHDTSLVPHWLVLTPHQSVWLSGGREAEQRRQLREMYFHFVSKRLGSF